MGCSDKSRKFIICFDLRLARRGNDQINPKWKTHTKTEKSIKRFFRFFRVVKILSDISQRFQVLFVFSEADPDFIRQYLATNKPQYNLTGFVISGNHMLQSPHTCVTLASIVLPMFPIYVIVIYFYKKVNGYLDDSSTVSFYFLNSYWLIQQIKIHTFTWKSSSLWIHLLEEHGFRFANFTWRLLQGKRFMNSQNSHGISCLIVLAATNPSWTLISATLLQILFQQK